MPESEVRRLPAALDAPLTRLAAAREDVTKDWMLRILERASLEQIERLPTERIARELPALVEALAAAAHADGRGPLPEDAVTGAAALADLRSSLGGSPAELAADVAALQAAVVAALRRDLAEAEPHVFAAAVERIAEPFALLGAAAVEQLVGRRSRELERLANTDELTGLHNVRYLRERLGHLHDLHRRYGHPFAVLVLDVDGLKSINDSRGHAAGDRALVTVAESLRSSIRAVDGAVRIGGDEFCVLAPQQTATRAKVAGERIANAIERAESADGVRLTVSIGVVSCPQHATEPERLMELADEAMYRAKALGARVGVALADGVAAAN